MKMRGFLYALLLAGCVPVADPLPVVDPAPVGGHGAPQASCGAEGLQDLVGQSADRLKVMRFAGPMRVILPGQMVTMDYQGDRITITVDAQGKISNLTCG
jgi:Peptidase inhibitor I78 family